VPITLVVRAPEPDGRITELAPLSFDGSRVVLGRGSACDVRLPDASVSGRHASLRAREGGWVVVDEGATNGTFINGERIGVQAPRPIKTGDVLKLGRVELLVRVGAAPITPPQQTRELAMALVARALGEERAGQPTLTVVEGPDAGATLVILPGVPRAIGRDPRCHLRLTDRALPPIAAEVSLEGTTIRVSQRDPRVPVSLGERTLSPGASLGWSSGVLLRLGATAIRLDDPVAAALEASANAEDERVPQPTAAPASSPPDASIANASGSAPAAQEPSVEPVVPVVPVDASAGEPAKDEEPAPVIPAPTYDRRRSWRSATLAFDVIALVVGVAVLAGSIAGLWWLLRK
jgi:pSer/pThr/pTyr-binding forkhead associated (FHA) protein